MAHEQHIPKPGPMEDKLPTEHASRVAKEMTAAERHEGHPEYDRGANPGTMPANFAEPGGEAE